MFKYILSLLLFLVHPFAGIAGLVYSYFRTLDLRKEKRLTNSITKAIIESNKSN